MLGLMNLTPTSNLNQSPPPHMVAQSPVNAVPRSPYNDSRVGPLQQPPHSQPPFGGFTNG